MKLERLNENQIRCTLTQTDLDARELKLSELAYGSEKAKALFQDMMSQASDELGFEAENIPLIIEAIPVSTDCIMLIVTKVEDPEELDTRFSKFSPFIDKNSNSDDDDDSIYTDSSEIMDIFKRLSNDILAKHTSSSPSKEKNAPIDDSDENEDDDTEDDDTEDQTDIHIRIFELDHLEDVCQLARLVPDEIDISNMLYKNPANRHYYLVLSSEGLEAKDFASICRMTAEFGHLRKASVNTLYYYDEHYEIIIRDRALQILRFL